MLTPGEKPDPLQNTQTTVGYDPIINSWKNARDVNETVFVGRSNQPLVQRVGVFLFALLLLSSAYFWGDEAVSSFREEASAQVADLGARLFVVAYAVAAAFCLLLAYKAFRSAFRFHPRKSDVSEDE